MDTTVLRKVIIITIFIVSINHCFSQFATIVDVDGIANNSLKEKIDLNATSLLTEINNAFANGTIPDLSGIEMSDEAKSSVFALWETSPFRCKETEIFDKILNLNSGDLELRNILLFVKEADITERNQEGVIIFTKNGVIDNLHLAIETKQWKKVMTEGNGVADLRRREVIVNFVEQFRTSYNRRDIIFLNKVFSEDALIISGKVIKEKSKDEFSLMQNLPKEKIVYVRQSKSEYLTKMQQIFDANSYINIKFDELKVVQHGKYPEIYGVTIKQYWNTTRYSDVGYVFLMIDFRDEENPIIHVRTWQPNILNGKEISEKEVFNIGSFGNPR